MTIKKNSTVVVCPVISKLLKNSEKIIRAINNNIISLIIEKSMTLIIVFSKIDIASKPW